MLNYNEILPGRVILVDGAPYSVLASQTTKKSRQKPSNQTKLKNLITGSVTEKAFHQSDNVEEAEIEVRTLVFIYERNGEWFFHPEGNKQDRFSLPDDVVGDARKYMKPNEPIEANLFDDQVVSLKVPIKVNLKVTEAPPSIRGNTSGGGNKQVTLETGAVVATPLFIETGDVISINTETNSYVERVEKA